MGKHATFITVSSVLLLQLLFAIPNASAADQGYRYREGRCVNERGQTGLNPGFIGQCGDLRNVILGRIEFDEVDFSGSRFTNADLQQSSLRYANLTGTDFESANLAGVDMQGAVMRGASFKKAMMRNTRLAEAQLDRVDFTEADLTGALLTYMEFPNCNFTFTILVRAELESASFEGSNLTLTDLSGANMRGARLARANLTQASFNNTTLAGASFEGARLIKTNLIGTNLTNANLRGAVAEEVALGGANLTGADLREANLKNANLRSVEGARAQLRGSNLDGADLRGAALAQADLGDVTVQGAKFNRRTTLPFDQTEAVRRGMVLQAGGRVFIIWDTQNATLNNIRARLQRSGSEVVLSSTSETQFAGNDQLVNYDTVIHLNQTTSATDMPVAGQRALVDFVRRGGRLIYQGYNAFEGARNRLQMMKDLILTTGATTTAGATNLRVQAGQRQHPLVEGLREAFTLDAGQDLGKLVSFASNPAVSLVKDGSDNDLVAFRNVGAGSVVGFAFDCAGGRTCTNDAQMLQLFVNAVNW